jgi:protein gp37
MIPAEIQNSIERLFSSPIVGINKNKAGRLLDGRTWDDMPALAVVEGDRGYRDKCKS